MNRPHVYRTKRSEFRAMVREPNFEQPKLRRGSDPLAAEIRAGNAVVVVLLALAAAVLIVAVGLWLAGVR